MENRVPLLLNGAAIALLRAVLTTTRHVVRSPDARFNNTPDGRRIARDIVSALYADNEESGV